jgi:hypothetical protein
MSVHSMVDSANLLQVCRHHEKNMLKVLHQQIDFPHFFNLKLLS